MIVCDRCKRPRPVTSNLKIKGKSYGLCKECSDCTENYIKYSFEPSTGLKKLLSNLGGKE